MAANCIDGARVLTSRSICNYVGGSPSTAERANNLQRTRIALCRRGAVFRIQGEHAGQGKTGSGSRSMLDDGACSAWTLARGRHEASWLNCGASR